MSGSAPAVIVIDRTRADVPAGRHLVIGFADRGTAEAYAEARTRASLERLRTHGLSAGELRRLWVQRGEECMLSDGSYLARERIDRYIAEPVTGVSTGRHSLPTGWGGAPGASTSPRWSSTSATGRPGWAASFTRPNGPTATPCSATTGATHWPPSPVKASTMPSRTHVSQLHELPDAPVPPAGQPLRNWLLEIDFVCHGVAFGVLLDAVFAWPNEPCGEILDAMTHVMIADALSVRGEGPFPGLPVRDPASAGAGDERPPNYPAYYTASRGLV